MQLMNLHDNGTIFENDPWNNDFFKNLRKRHLTGDLFIPCQNCVENAGVDPKRLVKKF